MSDVFMLLSASLGAVAQLGARLNGIQKVKGSNPFSSTKRNLKAVNLEIHGFPLVIQSRSSQLQR
jgi:hypothetical protein